MHRDETWFRVDLMKQKRFLLKNDLTKIKLQTTYNLPIIL